MTLVKSSLTTLWQNSKNEGIIERRLILLLLIIGIYNDFSKKEELILVIRLPATFSIYISNETVYKCTTMK